MIGNIVEFDDLKRLSGFDRRADVERWAQQIGLPYRVCRSGIWTTVEAMNATLGLADAGPKAPYPTQVI